MFYSLNLSGLISCQYLHSLIKSLAGRVGFLYIDQIKNCVICTPVCVYYLFVSFSVFETVLPICAENAVKHHPTDQQPCEGHRPKWKIGCGETKADIVVEGSTSRHRGR